MEYFELFAAMVTNREYDDVMDKEMRHKTKSWLGGPKTNEEKQKIQEYTMEYQEDISKILSTMNRKLLLVFKTNNYLRAIDNKLGAPMNTFNVLNNETWEVYKN